MGDGNKLQSFICSVLKVKQSSSLLFSLGKPGNLLLPSSKSEFLSINSLGPLIFVNGLLISKSSICFYSSRILLAFAMKVQSRQ